MIYKDFIPRLSLVLVRFAIFAQLRLTDKPVVELGSVGYVRAQITDWVKKLKSGADYWDAVTNGSRTEPARSVFLKAYDDYQQQPYAAGKLLQYALDQGEIQEWNCDPDCFIDHIIQEIHDICDQAGAGQKSSKKRKSK